MKKLYCALLTVACLTGFSFAEDMIKAAGSVFVDAAEGKTKKAPSAKIIGFYFSAHWCPPCRTFTPKLVEFYSALKQDGKDIEIIFVSSDKGEDEMMTYMKETSMPWLAVPYDSVASDALKEIKKEELNSGGIPALVIVRDGQIVTKNGRNDVQSLGSEAYQKWLKMEPEALEKVAEKKPSAKTDSVISAPEKKELDFNELTEQIINLDGKVIKTSINHVSNDFTQRKNGEYHASCGQTGQNNSVRLTLVMFPEEGKDFFQYLAKQNHWGGGSRTVYILVRGRTLEAVGTRYRKNKNEYSW